MRVAGFDWDDGNWPKCGRHGVSREDIEMLFRSDFAFAPDLKHSPTEARYIAVGRSSEGRAMFVAFTLRSIGGDELVRPVSARYMHAEEARRYGA